MKLRVCVEFIDKVTGETYRIGDVIEVAEERGTEILANPQGLRKWSKSPSRRNQLHAVESGVWQNDTL